MALVEVVTQDLVNHPFGKRGRHLIGAGSDEVELEGCLTLAAIEGPAEGF